MKLLVRADASNHIGSGHIMRCLALAEYLRPQATDIHFVCRRLPGEMHGLIEEKGFRCSLLSEKPISDAGANPVLDQTQDAQQTSSLTDRVDWLVADHYEIDHHWQSIMSSTCDRLMVIDDLANRSHYCNILLDQTVSRNVDLYQSLVPADCTVLTGTDYALLRPEFAAHRSAALARRKRCDGIRNVLVTMGGSDLANKTLEVLEVLAATNFAQQLTVSVVTGALYLHDETLLTATSSSFKQLDIRHNVSNMAQLMAASDLAIGAAGTTSWERCCLGLPALTYIYADNQREVARNLEAVGAIGVWENTSELKEHLEEFLHDASLYQRAVAAASAVCDGLGVERVVSVMRSC